MLVRDVMLKDILKVRPDDSALNVGNMMEQKLIGSALVIEDDDIRGIISRETFIANIDRIGERTLDAVQVHELMEADIGHVSADADIMAAVELLLTQKGMVDRIPVLDGGKVIGMVSKSEFTELFASRLKGRFKVADIMHYNPTTVFDYTPLTEVIEEIHRAAVKRVLVLSGAKLVGILSVRDLSLTLFHQKKTQKYVNPTSNLTAEDVMTRDPVTTIMKADAASAAQIMSQRNFGALPVVERALEGIITRTDLLKGYKLAVS